MTRSPKQSTYERTARERGLMRAMAKLMGWTPIDALGAYLTTDNHVVVVARDGSRYSGDLSSPVEVPDGTRPAGNVTDMASKRVRVPSAWPESDTWPITWNRFKDYAIEHNYSKRQYLANARELLAKHLKDDDKLQRKILTQMQAMTDALPDAPDWAQGIPIITDL